MSDRTINNKRIDNIYSMLESASKNLEKAKEMLRSLDLDSKKELYKEMPGLVGKFDGTNMVADDGQKYEVPANYAAKSRIVYGDTLKQIKEDDKFVYKQIEKVDRKKVEGILTKKEGKWYIISDSGTFKISDTAAEFQQAELNDEAMAFIPSEDLNAPFAALDKVRKKGQPMSFTKSEAPVDMKTQDKKPAGQEFSKDSPKPMSHKSDNKSPQAESKPAEKFTANTTGEKHGSKPNKSSQQRQQKGTNRSRGGQNSTFNKSTPPGGAYRAGNTGSRPATSPAGPRPSPRSAISRPPRNNPKIDASSVNTISADDATKTAAGLDDDDLR